MTPDPLERIEPEMEIHGERRAPYRPRYVPLWNNAITIIGAFLSVIALMLLLTFGLFTVVSPTTNPYVDIVGYLILPGALVTGLVVMPIGIFVKSWRLHRKNPTQKIAFRFPRIDLNDPLQRRVAKVFLGSTFVMLPVVGVSSYHGYHFTDSTEFCGKVCHTVMEPQATTYEHSAHARVSCAECHIGSGAGWFVKSKLSGTRQVLAVWRNSFSRPIPPAITELRPARETCEQCHWPRKFFGAQLREIVHFASDEQNTRRDISMLLKTGGGDEATGRAEGIHLHMTLSGRIEYIATDEKLQVIPWVRYVDDAGRELIYRSDGRPSSDPRPEGIVREIDCMDCHNRPAHRFRSPQEAVDIFLDVGKIDTTLPFIKREAVAVLSRPYPDATTADAQIAAQISDFYRMQYPEVWQTRKASVNNAIDKVRDVYRHNIFPDMMVDWRTYPDNIGHLASPGCFRCHEGKHVNQFGGTISHDCSICHTFLNPIKKNGDDAVIEQGRFIHPIELAGVHASIRCSECHSGGVTPQPTCAGCHTTQAMFRAGTLTDFSSLALPKDPMLDSVDCESCHDLSEPRTIEAIDAMCMDCHDDDEERFGGMLAGWKEEIDRLLAQAEGRVDDRGRESLERLKKAGPLHNVEATKKIVQSLLATPPAAPIAEDDAS